MPTELDPNTTTAVELGTTLTAVSIESTWLLVWSTEGETLYVVTGDYAEGDDVPDTARPIPPTALPFPFDVSPYGGSLFLAASTSCTAVLEARE